MCVTKLWFVYTQGIDILRGETVYMYKYITSLNQGILIYFISYTHTHTHIHTYIHTYMNIIIIRVYSYYSNPMRRRTKSVSISLNGVTFI